MDWYEISEVNLSKNKNICFAYFEFCVLNFSIKEETTRNIHNQNVVEIADCITVFCTQELGTCLGDTEILVWHLFSLGFLKSSLFHLT